MTVSEAQELGEYLRQRFQTQTSLKDDVSGGKRRQEKAASVQGTRLNFSLPWNLPGMKQKLTPHWLLCCLNTVRDSVRLGFLLKCHLHHRLRPRPRLHCLAVSGKSMKNLAAALIRNLAVKVKLCLSQTQIAKIVGVAHSAGTSSLR